MCVNTRDTYTNLINLVQRDDAFLFKYLLTLFIISLLKYVHFVYKKRYQKSVYAVF